MSGVENPAAFPFREIGLREAGIAVQHFSAGMTLRDWFAGQAVSGFAASAFSFGDWDEAVLARLSYQLADAMLSARASDLLAAAPGESA
jgi:hypothetical protein